MRNEDFLRKQIQVILEQEDQAEAKPKDSSSSKIKSVGVGRGGWKGRIKEAGALAKKDPNKLMKNLGVSGVNKRGGDLEILQDILEKAATGTEEMSAVFDYLKNQPKARGPKGNVLESATLSVSTVPPRDAMKYIEHTIVGATSAFSIDWKNNVEITKSGDHIVVYLK